MPRRRRARPSAGQAATPIWHAKPRCRSSLPRAVSSRSSSFWGGAGLPPRSVGARELFVCPAEPPDTNPAATDSVLCNTYARRRDVGLSLRAVYRSKRSVKYRSGLCGRKLATENCGRSAPAFPYCDRNLRRFAVHAVLVAAHLCAVDRNTEVRGAPTSTHASDLER